MPGLCAQTMDMGKVRVHKPVPGCHTWGVEYNYELEHRACYETDASDFVRAMYEYMRAQPAGRWFHQCGCDPDSRRVGYRGYQMFECWALNAQKECEKAARFVASRIGCQIADE